jgi:hypothetical protein
MMLEDDFGLGNDTLAKSVALSAVAQLIILSMVNHDVRGSSMLTRAAAGRGKSLCSGLRRRQGIHPGLLAQP